MSGAWSLRHSTQNREPTRPSPPTYQESGHLSRTRIDEKHQEISDREAERLAEKIVSVAADYMEEKSRQRFDGDWAADPNAAPTMDTESMANKCMKEAARVLMHENAKRNDGQVIPGSDAAKAEAVYAQRYDTNAPMHKVAEKVREKIAASEERQASPHEFVGVNPDGMPTPDVLKE